MSRQRGMSIAAAMAVVGAQAEEDEAREIVRAHDTIDEYLQPAEKDDALRALRAQAPGVPESFVVKSFAEFLRANGRRGAEQVVAYLKTNPEHRERVEYLTRFLKERVEPQLRIATLLDIDERRAEAREMVRDWLKESFKDKSPEVIDRAIEVGFEKTNDGLRIDADVIITHVAG